MSRPRALLIARNLPPLRGGIERLMQHGLAELAVEWDCDVMGPRGCAPHIAAATSVTELPAGYPGFAALALARLVLRPARGYRLVLASNGPMAPLARRAARSSDCPYIVWVHGLDLTFPHPIYRTLVLPAIRDAARIIANSHATVELAVGAGIARDRIAVIHPGVEVAEPVSQSAGQRLRDHFGLAGPLLLFVGRLVERKGLAEFVERALPAVLRSQPDAKLLVVGDEPGRGSRYRERVRAAAQRTGVAASVIWAGEVGDDALRAAYAAADVLVFPAIDRPGDVEGFGMVVIEAAAQGTPTVAFRVGGLPDAVSAASGALVAAGDYAALAREITGILAGTNRFDEARCRAHAQGYSWDRYGAAVRELSRTVTS